jgi:hypothetical protein
VVEIKFAEEIEPVALNSRWRPPVVERRFREEMKSEVAICRWSPPVVDTSWVPLRGLAPLIEERFNPNVLRS